MSLAPLIKANLDGRVRAAFETKVRGKTVVSPNGSWLCAMLDAHHHAIGYINLLAIVHPKQLLRQPLVNGVFIFQFVTIENVVQVVASHIVVGNDNNLPISSSREPNQADDNESILLTRIFHTTAREFAE